MERNILAGRVVAFALAHGYLSSSSLPQEVITLQLGTVSSQAVVEWGGLHHLPEALQSLGISGRIFIVTDADIGSLYTEPIQALLAGAGFVPQFFTIPAGESSKSLLCWQQILDWLVEHKAEHQEPILALGGGVVGDLSGFVAASYHRGVPLIQVPTSLLAQVDSAIGGKTGINHPRGKNLIGAYYQPGLIIVDPAFLLTLPERVYREGWAEIVKYGMILDADLFETLEMHTSLLHARDPALLTKIIAHCIRLKMDVVQRDERDGGLRNILNYGHTFGHALEALTDYFQYPQTGRERTVLLPPPEGKDIHQTLKGQVQMHYGTWLHGEAVSIGMEVAAQIAVTKGLLANEYALRQHTLLRALELPVRCPGVDAESVLAAMQRDKKVRHGCMRWVLPTHIGHAEVYDDIPLEVVQDAIAIVCSEQDKEG